MYERSKDRATSIIAEAKAKQRTKEPLQPTRSALDVPLLHINNSLADHERERRSMVSHTASVQ